MKKSKILPLIVLSSICIVVAIVLSVANLFTAPVIEEVQRQKAIEAMQQVYPASESFEEIDISAIAALPEEVKEAYSTSDGGYVFKISVKGYSTGLVIMCGVDAQGRITGSKCIESKETNGAETLLDGAYNGKSSSTISPVFSKGSAEHIANSTKTSEAYHDAMKAALASKNMLDAWKGGSVK